MFSSQSLAPYRAGGLSLSTGHSPSPSVHGDEMEFAMSDRSTTRLGRSPSKVDKRRRFDPPRRPSNVFRGRTVDWDPEDAAETFRALMEMREKYNAELALHQRQQDLHLVATQIQQVEALRAKFDVCWDYTQNKLRDDKRAVWQEVQNQSGELTRIRAQWGEAFNTLVRELQQAA